MINKLICKVLGHDWTGANRNPQTGERKILFICKTCKTELHEGETLRSRKRPRK